MLRAYARGFGPLVRILVRSVLVANFNGPELNELARYLAANGRLSALCRPYLNKGRAWERALAQVPLLGGAYSSTFGRRRIDDPALLARTSEAGVLADVAAALVSRTARLGSERRRRWTNALHEAVRAAVSERAGRAAVGSDCVVAFTGFGQPAFHAMRAKSAGASVLSYPIAHHRHHRKVREEELRREPAFAETWQGFEGWSRAYESQVDLEIDEADAILVGSRYVRDTFVGEGVDGAKIEVATYGVDVETFAPGPTERPAKRFNVVFAGQISQRKGLSYVLRGYREFARSGSQLVLVGSIVGSARPLQPFAPYFRHVPHLTRPALAQVFRDSDVLLFPSLVEGMPLTVLEAMATGLPVIVSPNGPADVVRDGVEGFVIDPRDETAIVDRLDRLERDPALRLQMGRNARARALEFTWSRYASTVVSILDEVMSRRRTGARARG